jgi:hypothetical protein
MGWSETPRAMTEGATFPLRHRRHWSETRPLYRPPVQAPLEFLSTSLFSIPLARSCMTLGSEVSIVHTTPVHPPLSHTCSRTMTGPVGAGHTSPLASRLNLAHSNHSTSSAGFTGLVHNIVKHHHASEQDHSPDGVKPSKRLPSTGLKRKTDEYKKEHPESDGRGADRNDGKPNGNGRPRAKRGDSGYSSSSSIPSDAMPGSPEKEEDQEGALGRGKGRHEREILDNGVGRITESPGEETPRHIAEQHSTPPRERDEEDSLVPAQKSDHATHDEPATRSAGKDVGENVKKDRERLVENGAEPKEGGSNRLTWGDDPEQKVIPRTESPYRQQTDEVGRYPDGLEGVKPEEPPGPRLDIVLDPRISYLHVRTSSC